MNQIGDTDLSNGIKYSKDLYAKLSSSDLSRFLLDVVTMLLEHLIQFTGMISILEAHKESQLTKYPAKTGMLSFGSVISTQELRDTKKVRKMSSIQL